MKPLRVLVVFNSVQLYGMERAVLQAFDLLRPEVEAHFVLTRTSRRLNLPVWKEVVRLKFSYHFLSDFDDWPRLSKPKGLRHLGALLRAFCLGNLDVLRALRKSRAEAILFPSGQYALFGILAAGTNRIRGRSTYLQFHDLPPRASTLLRLLKPLISTYLHGTEVGKEITLEGNPHLQSREHRVVANRTPLRSWSPRTCPLPAGRKALVYLGQIAPHKGLDLMIRAFLRVAANYPDADLHILGEGDLSYRRSLEELARPQEDRIQFWGYQEDVSPILGAAYLHIFPTPPSRFLESFGNVAVEAMSLGVPSLGFESGAVPSIIVDGETGRVVKKESFEALASAMEELLADPSLRDRMAQKARDRYKRSFSDEVIREQWNRALELS